jgi:ElaB/YqjD/DUF883 family membrane-anchored ribosome-binding protein
MKGHAERVLEDLQQLVAQFEELVKGSLSGAGEQVGDTSERLQSGLRRARERLASFERELGREFGEFGASARAADQYVRDHAWTAIGIAAAAAFLVGLIAARRD